MSWNSLFNPMALGPIAVIFDHLFIRIEKLSSLQKTTMSLSTFLFYIYILNDYVVGRSTRMRCLINGQELNLGYS